MSCRGLSCDALRVPADDDEWTEREPTDEDYLRVGQWVAERRKQLGLSRARVEKLGGPGTITQRSIEDGEPKPRRVDTTWPLERVLGWRPGDFRSALLQGRKPQPAVEPDYSGDTNTVEVVAPSRNLDEVADEDLLAEVARRMKRGAVAEPTPIRRSDEQAAGANAAMRRAKPRRLGQDDDTN